MSSQIIALLLLSGALLLALVILSFVFLRQQRRERRIALVLKPERNETLEQAAAAVARRAEAADGLAGLSARFSQLLDDCPTPVLILDSNCVIAELSSSAELDLDQPHRGRSLLEALGSHELHEAARRALDTGEPVEVTVRLYAEGRRPYHVFIFPYASGKMRECLVFLQDASSTVDYGELRSQFAATVSHELRTPLTGIRNMVESLQDPEIDPEVAARFLSRIDRETGRLGQLIDEILFLSSLESGAAADIRDESEVGPVAERVLEKLEPQALEFEVAVQNRVPEGFRVLLSERMVSIVLSNLVENAIRYSGRGSKVEMLAGTRDEEIAGTGRWAKLATITVRDDGIGIDAEHLPHVFERFYRVDKSRSRRLGGTGLGLSIVKHVAESAGGEVEAKSREGYGTEVTVSLPAGPPSP